MKTSTRFLAVFAAAWLARAAITAASVWEYSPEDFTLFDLAMFGSMLGLGGLMMCGAVGFPTTRPARPLRDGRVLISGGYDEHMNNSAGIWIFQVCRAAVTIRRTSFPGSLAVASLPRRREDTKKHLGFAQK
jgi:hypothetical protein